MTSIVGRFLEHTRLYWFANGGSPELFAGSADLMGRNLDRRMETLFPIDDVRLRDAMHKVLMQHLEDSTKSRRLDANGNWTRAEPQARKLSIQRHLVEQGGSWRLED